MIKFAFQIDPIENLNLETDTTWQFMIEAQKRGTVYFYTPRDLFWKGGKVLANVHEIHIRNKEHTIKSSKTINLQEVDVIFIRQNPPYDMNYLTTTYLLDQIGDEVLIINSPRAIRNFPEKISPLKYSEFIPPTIISNRLDEIKNFAGSFNKIILKPLYSFAGNDIFCISHNDINFDNIFTLLYSKYNTALIAQKFIDKVTEGDKRVILANGEILGAYNRLPKKNSIVANAAQGGTTAKTILSDRELQICSHLNRDLIQNKIYFAGIDIIDGFLTEINITSPTGVVTLQNHTQQNIVSVAFDKFLEKYKNI